MLLQKLNYLTKLRVEAIKTKKQYKSPLTPIAMGTQTPPSKKLTATIEHFTLNLLIF